MRSLLFLTLFALLSLSLSQKVLSGTWWLSSKSIYNCPSMATFFKINETNSTSHATTFNYFNSSDAEFNGTCRAIDSVIQCGQLVTTFQCDRTGIFAGSFYNTTVTWDSYSSLSVNVSINFNITNSSGLYQVQACNYYGQKQPFSWLEGDWRITSCSCSDSCCYQLGSYLNLKALTDWTNRPRANLTGNLVGDFCNNTMTAQDTCWLEGASSGVANFTTWNLNCTTMGCKNSPVQLSISSNQSSTAVLNWNGCYASAVLRGSTVDRSSSFGGRLGWTLALVVMMMVMVWMQ